MTALAIEDIKLDRITENPANTRRTFKDIGELAESIKRQGVLQPISVRPKGKGYELIFGARRFRASQLAGVATIPAIVRDLNDEQTLEAIIVENLQRAGVHPLEEARSFHSLQHDFEAKHDVAAIAAKVGRSPSYVYDRLKLLSLIKKAQDLFHDERFTAGHAVILARLTPEQQEQALDPDTGGVFEYEQLGGLFDQHQDGNEEALTKPRSVRELQAWVDKRFQLDPAAEHMPMLFPQTAQAVTQAQEKAEKILHLTLDPNVKALGDDGQRIYLPQHWKRADGLVDELGDKTRPCDQSVTGVVVIGPFRGEAFKVCTEKRKCEVHWADEIKAAAAAKEAASAAPDGKGKAKTAASTYVSSWDKEQEKRRTERARYEKAVPLVLAAIEKAMGRAPVAFLASVVIKAINPSLGVELKEPKKGTAPVEILRGIALALLKEDAQEVWNVTALGASLNPIGVNVKKLIDEAHAEEQPTKAAAAKKPAAKKAPAKKKGKAKR